MPLIEVEESDYHTAAAAKAVLDRLGGNPKTRRRLLEVVKEFNPDASIPELDAAAPLEAKVSAVEQALDERFSKLERQLADRDATESFSSSIQKERKKLRKDGWDDDAIGKIEKLMEEEGFVNYAAAAALYEKSLPKAKQDETLGVDFTKDWGFRPPSGESENPDLKLLFSDRTGKSWMNSQLRQYRTEKAAQKAGQF